MTHEYHRHGDHDGQRAMEFALEQIRLVQMATPSASVTTTNAAPQALQPADHGRGVDEAAQPTVGSREVATTPAGAAPSKSDLAHWLMACHEEREHPVYHDERFRLAAESIQSATLSTRDEIIEECAQQAEKYGRYEDPASAIRALKSHATDSPVTPRFENVFCSQCGKDFGPGDHGYSSCKDHRASTGSRSDK